MNRGPIDTIPIARWASPRLLLTPALLLSLLTPAVAQNADELAKQQMEVMKQYMEAAGMSAEDIARTEALAKGSMAPIVEAQTAQETREQAEFEARTAGLGKAVVSMPGKDIELQITECVSTDDGNFRVKAQANHTSRSDSLHLGGNSHYKRNELQMFLKGVGEYDIWIEPMLALEDGRFAWTGTADGGNGATEVAVVINCEPKS